MGYPVSAVVANLYIMDYFEEGIVYPAAVVKYI